MISERTVKQYCNGDITKIENYELAMNDTAQVYDCHHRLEISPMGNNFSREYLIEQGLYYNQSPNALIFLAHSEHTKLHNENMSLERKQKMSESQYRKKVICIETNEVFSSTVEAAKVKNCPRSKISNVCLGKRKTTGGYHWKFA